MKLFVKHILKIAFVLAVSAYALDFCYTIILSQSATRNKIENVINSLDKKYDVVIMGTSRANNHFVPALFEKKGYQTFNYGMSGSHLFETSLLLKLMIANHYKIKHLILEADLSMCNEKRDEGTTARFMPYLHQNNIISDHYKKQSDFFQLFYIPFYRYIKFDSKIGFRELREVVARKKTNAFQNKGYYPLVSLKKSNMKNDIASLKVVRNRYYEEIKKICSLHKINLQVVMTPMCSNTKGLDYFYKLNQLYPEIHNFENVITNDKYFSSCGHLNDEGAKIFTNILIKKLDFNAKK
ncbi:hypothetical protein [Flavobacterium psychrophilum]|uniref:hypothetical protein n=1 Tax=Flavobacterium psychrophilum TaxID=96345 RepID=UPI000B7C1BA7|nr:hypothetical protein [Flavobacterium psychrophilum]ELM3649376.1 hypothetical protein [Flavobacterium psychrophilum]ELM3670222.1 hypothetical protein [Flavobacterium psychrophilum]ELM3724936.1 hypothetical protein [Flavobacterium psychrophilum]ELY1991311.1 hypothetical protein [Flavobacterium psychrophilum]MCB6087613.1 hypothetical protein [Flavobacterium psychrophilum]